MSERRTGKRSKEPTVTKQAHRVGQENENERQRHVERVQDLQRLLLRVGELELLESQIGELIEGQLTIVAALRHLLEGPAPPSQDMLQRAESLAQESAGCLLRRWSISYRLLEDGQDFEPVRKGEIAAALAPFFRRAVGEGREEESCE